MSQDHDTRPLRRALTVLLPAALISGAIWLRRNKLEFRDERDIQIKCPVEEVFDFIADTRNEMKWTTEKMLLSVEKTTDGPVGKGTRFKGTYKLNGLVKFEIGVVEFGIIEYERPAHLKFQGTGRAFSYVSIFDFAPTDGSTSIHHLFDLQPQGLQKLLVPFVGLMAKRSYAEREMMLKRVLEKQ
jgi:Polyketide cyclase / dehydrase and lipid transport